MSGRRSRRTLGVVVALIVAGALNVALFALLAMLNRFESPELPPKPVVRLRSLKDPEPERVPTVEPEPAPVDPDPATDEFLPVAPDLAPVAAAALDLPMPPLAFSIPAIRITNVGAVVGADPSIRTPITPPRNNGQQGAVGTGVRRATEIDEPPRPVKYRKPAYPMSADRRGIEGSVTIRLVIDKEGKVESVEVLEIVGYQGFGAAVLKVASGWEFTPPRNKGRRLRVSATKTIEFKKER
ncbi:MAG: TonB family protein [Planctomycetota bacterium]